MRTTLTIDDDLMEALKELAHREGLPLKRIVNRVLRGGLAEQRRPRKSGRYRCPTFAMGEVRLRGVDLDRALALAAALEDEEIARKLDMRK